MAGEEGDAVAMGIAQIKPIRQPENGFRLPD